MPAAEYGGSVSMVLHGMEQAGGVAKVLLGCIDWALFRDDGAVILFAEEAKVDAVAKECSKDAIGEALDEWGAVMARLRTWRGIHGACLIVYRPGFKDRGKSFYAFKPFKTLIEGVSHETDSPGV